jgi:hypothetical protein
MIMSHEKELETLRKLKRHCEIAIDLIENGLVVSDPDHSVFPFDFILGNFGVIEDARFVLTDTGLVVEKSD